MSNSPLITCELRSPNRTHPRSQAIDTVTIHCVVGQVTALEGCRLFQSTSRNASCNYVVGKDGSIGLCVDEEDRSWCTGGTLSVNGMTGKMNDHRAVTIEVACESKHPYAVTAAAYEALIRLVADIAQRNGMGALRWKGDKTLVGKPGEQNLTVHRWFAKKACPGDYLYGRMGEIAARANEINGVGGHTDAPSSEGQGQGHLSGPFGATSTKGEAREEPAPWAKGAWEKAVAAGVLDGTRPGEPITRQEVAVILDRLGALKGGGA